MDDRDEYDKALDEFADMIEDIEEELRDRFRKKKPGPEDLDPEMARSAFKALVKFKGPRDDQIRSLFRIIKRRRMYTDGEEKPSVRSNAISTMKVEGEPLVIVDNSGNNSGKSGFVMTGRGIHAHNSLLQRRSGTYFISWDDFCFRDIKYDEKRHMLMINKRFPLNLVSVFIHDVEVELLMEVLGILGKKR